MNGTPASTWARFREVAHTYNVVGNMNEHQLVIAESTWGGRKECADTTARP